MNTIGRDTGSRGCAFDNSHRKDLHWIPDTIPLICDVFEYVLCPIFLCSYQSCDEILGEIMLVEDILRNTDFELITDSKRQLWHYPLDQLFKRVTSTCSLNQRPVDIVPDSGLMVSDELEIFERLQLDVVVSQGLAHATKETSIIARHVKDYAIGDPTA